MQEKNVVGAVNRMPGRFRQDSSTIDQLSKEGSEKFKSAATLSIVGMVNKPC